MLMNHNEDYKKLTMCPLIRAFVVVKVLLYIPTQSE